MATTNSIEARAKKKIEEAVQAKKDKDDKANTAIWSAVALSAGLGGVPLGINIWGFMGVNAVLIMILGSIYGHHMTKEGAAHLIRQIFVSLGATFFMMLLGLKFGAEVLKVNGIFTFGTATVAGMALDAGLAGAITFALGYTSKEYFKKNKQLSKEEMRKHFKDFLKAGREQIKRHRSAKGV
jgi:uncharacterized protein (DUF697 family)